MIKIKSFNWGQLTFEYSPNATAIGIGFRFFGNENTLNISFHFFFSVWFGISIDSLNKLVNNNEEGWKTGINIDGKYLSINFFNKKTISNIFIDLKSLFLGQPKFTSKIVSAGERELIMPEKRYLSVFELVRNEWYYPRFKILKYEHRLKIAFDEDGVPIPNKKGENDGIKASSSQIDYEHKDFSLKRAYNDFSLHVLSIRQKYADLDWLPTKKNKLS